MKTPAMPNIIRDFLTAVTIGGVAWLVLVMMAATAFAVDNRQLKVATSGLYVAEQDGTPVFLNGTSTWDLAANLTYTQAQRLLDSCATHKINYLQVRPMTPACCGTNATQHANAYGVLPWSGTQTFASTIVEAYWLHVDSVVDYAATKGVYIMLYADYLGADPTQGWSSETNNSSLTVMYQWGQLLGARYKDKWNVLWAIGGDTDPTNASTQGWNLRAKLDTLARGLVQAGVTQLITTRDESGTSVDDHWTPGSSHTWITLNYAYSYTLDWWDFAQTVRSRIPAMPADLRETYYENESPLGHTTTQLELRRSLYQFVIWAFPLVIYGNCPLWNFDGFSGFAACDGLTWTNQLNTQGMKNMTHLWQLFTNRRYWALVPDTSNVAMTSGFGAGSTRAVAAWTYDSTCILAYTPADQNLTVTSARLRNRPGDSTYAWWFNTETGAATWIGNFSQSSQVYNPPQADLVLVLDAKYMNYSAPGLDTTVTEPPTTTYVPWR